MATHGTIWLTNSREPEQHILLQTPSDGHEYEAIKMICDLPRYAARVKDWHARTILLNYERWGFKKINFELISDAAAHHSIYEWDSLLQFAHLMVTYQPDRWRIIPAEFQNYLADYDLNPEYHLYVELYPIIWQDDDQTEYDHGVVIYADWDEHKSHGFGETVEQFVEKNNRPSPPDRRIDIRWTNEDKSKKGIFIPFEGRLREEMVAITLERKSEIERERLGQEIKELSREFHEELKDIDTGL